MNLAGEAPRILLDASPFFRFAAAGWKGLAHLGRYLGDKATVTAEVHFELERNAKTLKVLQNLPRLGWPPPPPLVLPPTRREELFDIKRGQSLGGHAKKDLGEISTVLMAQELGDATVVMDDRLGRQLCGFRQVPRLSTAQLAAEMVAQGALPRDLGWAVYEDATPAGVGAREFEKAVATATAAYA